MKRALFGMEGMFRQLGIYSSEGQKYVPHDSDQIMFYKEDKPRVDFRRNINESRRYVRLDCLRHGLFQLPCAHGAFLHLLLHVWLPAHR